MHFDFATASRIIFGRGVVKQLPALARPWGTRALLVTGRSAKRAAGMLSDLQSNGIQVCRFPVVGEPTVDTVRIGAQLAREAGCELVIGFSGGSAMDAAKAIAAVSANSGEPMDYIEVVGRGLSMDRTPLPFFAIPTTAGTGAEVTRNAVLGVPQHGLKASLRSASMLAKVALVDPELTAEMPPDVTAYTGLDALTQLIEPYVSCRANAFVDALCLDGLKHVADSLEQAINDGRDLRARESMSYAALLSGLALANAGLGAVHGFAAPLGGMLNAPHGTLCAAVLPHAVAINIEAARQLQPQHPALTKYAAIAQLLTGGREARPEALPAWLASLTRRVGIPSLGALGLRQEQIPALVEKAAVASSMKANPIQLTTEQLTRIAKLSL